MKNKLFLISFMLIFILGSLTAASASTIQDKRLTTNLYIIFDASGSMFQVKCSGEQRKITVAKRALITFLKTVPERYNLGLFVFGREGSHEVSALGTMSRTQLIKKVRQIKAGGKTPLCNALKAAKQKLLLQKKKQLNYGEYIVLVVTDGEANNKNALPRYVQALTNKGIVVQVIGFCLTKSHSLKNMVDKYRDANSPEELKAALQSVLGEAETFNDTSEFEMIK